MSKIFFYNKLTDKECLQFWDKFAALSNKVQSDWENIDGWTEQLIEADRKNQKLRAKIALKRRIQDIVESPQSLLRELIINPEKLFNYCYYLVKDIRRFF